MIASSADRLELLDLLALWHELDYRVKHRPHTGSVKGSDYDNLA